MVVLPPGRRKLPSRPVCEVKRLSSLDKHLLWLFVSLQMEPFALFRTVVTGSDRMSEVADVCECELQLQLGSF